MIYKANNDTTALFAIRPKHPTRKAADRILGINGVDGYSEPGHVVKADSDLEYAETAVNVEDYMMDVVEIKSPRQALAVMDTSDVAIMHEGKVYPIDETNVNEQFDLVVAGNAPTVDEDEKFGTYKLEHFVKDPIAGGEEEEADVLGKKLNVIQRGVVIKNKIMTGELLKVAEYTGFNGSDKSEQNGYYLVFWVDKDAATTAGYSEIKFFVVGGKNTDGVEPDQGMNVIFLGDTEEDVYKKTLGMKAKLTIQVDDETTVEDTVEIAFENKLVPVDMEEQLTVNPTNGVMANNPIVDEANKRVYLNGVEGTVRVNSNGKGAEIVANGKVLMSGYMTGWTLFGGGPAGTHIAKSRINVDTVQVGGLNVFGGGEGSYDQSEDQTLSADVDETVIVIRGNCKLNNVFGGGAGRAVVKKSTVVVDKGSYQSICGGGMAYVDANHNIEGEYAVHPENSPNRVMDANVIIHNAVMNMNALVYGGGSGYACTDKSNVVINNITATSAWVTGGGSNGYIGEANVTINNAHSLKVASNINRGWSKKATLTINGGTITNVYAGADEEDTKTSQMEFHGCQEKLTVIINGGTITNLLPGYNYTAIEANDPKVEVFVSKNAEVVNLETAKAKFGTSITVEGAAEVPGTDEEEKVEPDTDSSDEGTDVSEPVD